MMKLRLCMITSLARRLCLASKAWAKRAAQISGILTGNRACSRPRAQSAGALPSERSGRRSVGRKPVAQLLRAHEHEDIVHGQPFRHVGKRCNEVVVALRALRRAGLLTHLSKSELDGRARDLDQTQAAMAPQVDLCAAVGSDLEHRYAPRTRERTHVEQHFLAERKRGLRKD